MLSANTSAPGVPVDEADWRTRVRDAYDRLAFPLAVRAEFYTVLADSAAVGIAPSATIEELLGVALLRRARRMQARVYQGVLDVLATGTGLPAALAHWIPTEELVMLRGAEVAGTAALNSAFAKLGQLLHRQAEVRQKLKRALWVNAGNLSLIVGVMVEVIATMVPEVDKSVTPAIAAKMPFAVAYFGASEWLLRNGAFVLIGLLAAMGGVAYSLGHWAGERRRFFDQHIFPYTLYQRFQATLFLSTGAAMLQAGITLNSVLADMKEYANPWLQFYLDTMQEALDGGEGEVKALALGPLPTDTSDSLRYYRLIPRFQDVMARLSEGNFKRYERSIELLSSALNVASTFLMAIFAVCTLIAMFNFSDAMQGAAPH